MTLIRMLAAAAVVAPAMFAQYTAYFGTYTRPGKSKGIYAYRFDAKSGKFTAAGLAAETPNPSFLAVHPNGKFVYAVNEQNDGMVSAFAIDGKTGLLKPLNQVSSKGSGPCHLALDRNGKWLFAANYNSGSVAAYAVRDDGSLGESSGFDQHKGSSADPGRQKGPHAHGTFVSRDNRFVLVPDLGLDKVFVYRVDDGKLPPDDPPFFQTPPGSGPRHLAFHPTGKFAYVLTEMGGKVVACKYNAGGALEEMQTVDPLPADYQGARSGAEIEVHPNGRFLYASLRGNSNTIAVFAVDPGTGKLTAAGRVSSEGKTPRAFEIDPTGTFLIAANQDSDDVVVFRIDGKTGALTATGEKLQIGAPVSVVFVKEK
jgi:6-phosphogluconolactonase